MKFSLDLLQEKRDDAHAMTAAYKQRTARCFNKRVKPRQFKIGDWVLRNVSIATQDLAKGKLGPTWEGPYKVVQSHQQGAYYLQDVEGRPLPRPWNADHLKIYYL